MDYYFYIQFIVGIVLGILLAIKTKKPEDVTSGRLDNAGRITNVILLVFYMLVFPIYCLIGLLCAPAHDGFLGFLGVLLTIFCSSVTLFCSVGLGLSVALRKRGKSGWSFAVQFLGMAAFVLMLVLFFSFYDDLLLPLN